MMNAVRAITLRRMRKSTAGSSIRLFSGLGFSWSKKAPFQSPRCVVRFFVVSRSWILLPCEPVTWWNG